jgi:hypothetical protein
MQRAVRAPRLGWLRSGAIDELPGNPLYRVLTSTWTLGALAAIASWNLAVGPPGGGLDASWVGGLYMAVKQGLHFGTQIVFTYGPLGFLRFPDLWYQDLAILAFVYSGALYFALCITLVWGLRRTLNGAAAFAITFLILAAASAIEVPVALAAIWCLIALSPQPPRFAWPVVVLGGAVLGATETLVTLRSGPLILVMCAIAMLVHERRWRYLPIFAGCATVVFALLWFGSGQRLADLPHYFTNGAQIVSGYSEAMGAVAESGLYLPGSLLVSATLIAVAAISSRPGKSRLAAAAVVGVASFALFKEAAVRADLGHASIFFGTTAALGAGIAFGRQRLLAGASAAGLLALAATTPFLPLDFNPITHARQAGDDVGKLVSPARTVNLSKFGLLLAYGLQPSTSKLLSGYTVHVDPWEAALAWAEGLRWDPLPVFQEYSAYTTALDRLNADALRSRAGPQRILREDTSMAVHEPTADLDDRFSSWDPPETSLAMLCNYVALQTTAHSQVLGKVPDRCGAPRLIASMRARAGEDVNLPAAEPNTVIYAKLSGAGVSGLERLRTLLYTARFRHLTVNRTKVYRLVPGTAADGLIMDAGAKADYPAPFALSPAARTISISGASGTLRVDMYSVVVRQPGAARAPK